MVYIPAGYFYLPTSYWINNYYRPMQDGFDAFFERNGRSDQASEIINYEKAEIALYEKYQDHYSYGIYIAKKI